VFQGWLSKVGRLGLAEVMILVGLVIMKPFRAAGGCRGPLNGMWIRYMLLVGVGFKHIRHQNIALVAALYKKSATTKCYRLPHVE
jgi:hypothetical protein